MAPPARLLLVRWTSRLSSGITIVSSHFGVFLLHLLADTGNKTNKLRIREDFLPVENVKVRVRVPEGRSVRSVSLLRGGAGLQSRVAGGWVEVTVPRILIHDAVRVDLG